MRTVIDELDDLRLICRKTEDVTPRTLDLYVDRLSDLPAELVIQAIREMSKSATFFPSVGEIRNRAVQIVAGPVLVDPEAAFGEVMRQVRRVGSAGKVTSFINGESVVIAQREFTSPLIEKAVDAIGWDAFCQATEEDMGTLRAQFRDALRVTQNREVDRVVSGRATDGAALTALQRGGVPAIEKGRVA